MAKKAAKPKGWNAFAALAKRVASVPKTEVDRRESERVKRKPKK